jgi:LysR family hydrogen peroxide-inducible transcriptional activator
MTLQELAYFVAVAEHRHFGRAAEACHISQSTLSGQLRKLEEHLGVPLFERNNRHVFITPAGEKVLTHARRALEEVGLAETAARPLGNQLLGPFKLGVIPTVAPHLIPIILEPLRQCCPELMIELWEDITSVLLERLRCQQLDAAVIATEIPDSDLTALSLFNEPFLAALPPTHNLASRKRINEADLANDLLVLADAHCLAGQARAVCSKNGNHVPQRAMQASSLETLANLVAAGYGTTLVPQLAVPAVERLGVVIRPLKGKAFRTIRLVSRLTFARPRALRELGRVIKESVASRPHISDRLNS